MLSVIQKNCARKLMLLGAYRLLYSAPSRSKLFSFTKHILTHGLRKKFVKYNSFAVGMIGNSN